MVALIEEDEVVRDEPRAPLAFGVLYTTVVLGVSALLWWGVIELVGGLWRFLA